MKISVHSSGKLRAAVRCGLLLGLAAASLGVARAHEVTELEPIQVEGRTEQGYVAQNSSAGTKTDTPLLETPMAIQVVPQEVIADRVAVSSMEAVKNVSGVQSQPGTFYDQFLIRGFDSGYGVSFRDGLQLEGIGNAVNMAFVDHIEVVKGPASMLYGRVEPGGFVNVVTRKPQADAALNIEQQLGSWGLVHTTADGTGAFDADHTLLYRVIGVYDKADSWVDNDHRNNKAAAAYLSYLPSTRFEFNLDFEYYDYKSVSPDGSGYIPVVGSRPLDLPRDFSAGDPALWSDFPYTVERTLVGFDWNYAFDDDWKLTQRFHYVNVDETQTNLGSWGFDGVDTVTRGFIYNPLERDIYGTNLDLTGTVETGGISHKLLFGVDSYRYQDDWKGYLGADAGIPTLDIYNPVYGGFTDLLHTLADGSLENTVWKTDERDSGIYAQDQMSIDEHWDVLLGGRYDWAKVGYANNYGMSTAPCYPTCDGGGMTTYKDQEFSPRAALLYKLNVATSVYGSYARSFGSNNGFTATGERIDPQVGTQYELGLKANLFDGRVTSSATLFHLTKTNVLTPDPQNPGLSIPVGEIRSQGLELDLAGQLGTNVSVIGSYTYDDATITEDNSGNEGNTSRGVPRHSSSVWAKYDSAPGAAQGWAAGAGLYLNGQREGNNANDFQLPGYGKVDVMAAYRMKAAGHPLTLQLNVKNLFDKTYFESTDGGTNAYYGAPRTLIGAVSVDL